MTRGLRGFVLALIVCSIPVSSQPAFALPYYFDIAGGLSRLQKGSAFFGDSGADSADMGTAFNFAFLINVVQVGSAFAMHAGLDHRLTIASYGAANYGMQATYLALRIESKGFFIGAEITPFIWRRLEQAPGIAGYSSKTGFAALLTAGFEVPISPEISFFIAAGAQTVSSGGSLSPMPWLDGSAGFRLFYGSSDIAGGGGKSGGKYQGWRYPFGVEIGSGAR